MPETKPKILTRWYFQERKREEKETRTERRSRNEWLARTQPKGGERAGAEETEGFFFFFVFYITGAVLDTSDMLVN